MECSNCELCKQADSPCIMGVGKKNARIMFIQDFPNDIDDSKGKPFSGATCGSVRRALINRDIPLEDIYWTSLVKCCPTDEEIKNPHINACKEILETEIEIINPDIIVPVGKHILKLIVGKNTLSKMRGNALEQSFMGRDRIILPMLNPRSVRVSPINKEYILNDLDTLKDLYENGMPKASGVTYRYLETVADVQEEIERMLNEAEIISFDLETTGLDAFAEDSKIICISLTDKTHYGVAIPLFHKDTPFTKDELQVVIELIRKLLESDIPKVAHNGKFDIKWLLHCLNIDVKEFTFDTMLAHYIGISEEPGTQGLKSQAWEFTDMGGYDNSLDEYKKTLPSSEQGNYGNISWEILREYAVADVDCCLRLYYKYKPIIDDNPQWKVLMSDILMPVSYTLRDIESNGFKMDMELAKHYQEVYSAEEKRITKRLYSYPEVSEIEREKQILWEERERIKLIKPADRTELEKQKFKDYAKYKDYKFNFGSTSQLAELLYDKLGLVTEVKTEKGTPSTNKEALEDIRKQHEIPDLLLELRKINILNNMFIQKLPNMVDKNEIIHPSFSISSVVTGRTASMDPNIQQIPRKAENPLLFQYHNEPKALFISRFGEEGCIMNADYAALELKIAGIISGDEKMKELFLSGADLHKSTASLVFNVPIDKVTKDLRTSAKAVN